MSSFGRVDISVLPLHLQRLAREKMAEREPRVKSAPAPPAPDIAPQTHAFLLWLPWSDLVSDNDKEKPAPPRNGKSQIWLTREYRTAKKTCREKAVLQSAGQEPHRGRVSIAARFYEPNRDRVRDISNYAKLIHDALRGIAYIDDGQIDVVRYERGPVDRDCPRVELIVRPL